VGEVSWLVEVLGLGWEMDGPSLLPRKAFVWNAFSFLRWLCGISLANSRSVGRIVFLLSAAMKESSSLRVTSTKVSSSLPSSLVAPPTISGDPFVSFIVHTNGSAGVPS
jgi:hypothetical protein